MKYTEILENLKSALAVRFFGQKAFRKKIGETLGISVSMVSRKLSGETHFTAEEISVLCEELNIPIHEIYSGKKDIVWQPLQLPAVYDISFSDEENREVLDLSVDMFSYAAQSDYSTFYITCNTFPDILNPSFDWVARFSALQWKLLNKGLEAIVPLSEMVEMPERPLMKRYISAVHSLKRSVYLVSYRILENYIAEIRKFYLMGHINKVETAFLVSELEEVLELFERICINGRLDNGKEIEIYCTDLFLPSDMYILESGNINFGVFHPNPVSPVITRSTGVCRMMTRWFDIWRRSANLISQSGTHLRRRFVAVQHGILENFKAEMGFNTLSGPDVSFPADGVLQRDFGYGTTHPGGI